MEPSMAWFWSHRKPLSACWYPLCILKKMEETPTIRVSIKSLMLVFRSHCRGAEPVFLSMAKQNLSVVSSVISTRGFVQTVPGTEERWFPYLSTSFKSYEIPDTKKWLGTDSMTVRVGQKMFHVYPQTPKSLSREETSPIHLGYGSWDLTRSCGISWQPKMQCILGI